MDHKSLEHVMSQKNLSARQHRWIDILNEFDFTIHYIPGKTNVLADTLSQLYSDEPIRVIRAETEYVNENPPEERKDAILSKPVYTGNTAIYDSKAP